MAVHAISHVPTEYGEILLNESSGEYWHLNDSAAMIFKLLRAGSTQEEVVQDLVDAYEIPSDQARTDVASLEIKLKEVGAV